MRRSCTRWSSTNSPMWLNYTGLLYDFCPLLFVCSNGNSNCQFRHYLLSWCASVDSLAVRLFQFLDFVPAIDNDPNIGPPQYPIPLLLGIPGLDMVTTIPQHCPFPDVAWHTHRAHCPESPVAVSSSTNDERPHLIVDSSPLQVYICQICQRGSLTIIQSNKTKMVSRQKYKTYTHTAF